MSGLLGEDEHDSGTACGRDALDVDEGADAGFSVLTTEDIGPLKEQGVISGGMIPKIDCALHAIESGVERVAMINGTLPHSILVEMLTKGGIGTLVKTGPRTAASA